MYAVGFTGGSVVKNLPAKSENARDVGSVPGLGRSSGGGNGNPLQYSCLGSPMDRRVWLATVHRVTESDMTENTLTLAINDDNVFLSLSIHCFLSEMPEGI